MVDEFGATALIEFGEDQPDTLLLAFSLECAACDEVFPLWNEVIPVENSNALRVIPINLGPPDSFSDGEGHALPVQAYSISPADLELFRKIAFGASVDAGRSVQVIRELGAPADHPVSLDHPEGTYLSGLLLQL